MSYCNLCNGQCTTIGHATLYEATKGIAPMENLEQAAPPRPTRHSPRTIQVVIANITEAQELAIRDFFAVWQFLGGIGSSRWTCFYADGDGNFRPKITVDGEKPKHYGTPEEITTRWHPDYHGEYRIDFDSIAWQLTDPDTTPQLIATEREPQRSEVKPNEAQSQKSAAIEQARPQTPELEKLFSFKPIYPEMAYNTKNLTERAAAEPAPERTPPQSLQPYLDRLIEESQKAEMKLRSIAADKLWERKEAADLVKLIVMFSDSIKNLQQALANARAVAVPEPAAQQESVAALKEIISIFEEGSNGQPFTTLKRIAAVAKTAIGEVV